MTSYVFKVVVEPDEHEDGREAYHAYCPDFEEAVTWGDTRKEAVQRINELLQTLVQMRIEKGEHVPAIQQIESSASEAMSGPSRPSSGFVPLGDLAGAVVADAGREVVVDVDGVDACSASRCRSSDWEPSAFETRA